ncbi:MAG: serine--tRNA ligase, partial [Nanoarchaeota archaeon]|nr:serine--tRNA ligase [Nanoarchaeota archaeon]
MLDIKFIRENPDKVKKNIKKKFQENKLELVDKFLTADKQHRELMKESQELRHKRNIITDDINKAKKKGKDAKKLIEKAKKIPAKIKEIEEKQNSLAVEIKDYLYKIPNMIHESVPIGKDEKENVEIKKIGTPKNFAFEVKNHAELAEELGVIDFDISAEISGKGF